MAPNTGAIGIFKPSRPNPSLRHRKLFKKTLEICGADLFYLLFFRNRAKAGTKGHKTTLEEWEHLGHVG